MERDNQVFDKYISVLGALQPSSKIIKCLVIAFSYYRSSISSVKQIDSQTIFKIRYHLSFSAGDGDINMNTELLQLFLDKLRNYLKAMPMVMGLIIKFPYLLMFCSFYEQMCYAQ